MELFNTRFEFTLHYAEDVDDVCGSACFTEIN